MSLLNFIIGKPDYNERSRRMLKIIEKGVTQQGKPLQGKYHEYLLTEHIRWIEFEFPKEAKPWIEATRRRCKFLYPKLHL